MILLTNLGYNFSRLVKSIFEKNITILVPFDKKINVLKKTLYKLFNVSFFDFKYSKIGSSSNRTVQPEADLSAEASESSKACSIFKSDKPSISKHLPEKIFFLV